ncbi:hypothetical protein [Cetobacterium sp.]|uniref:hypothetical protein n=1 Tax=Cetobacterium sp. TaxID=2071632 RepID=UPI002FC6D61D
MDKFFVIIDKFFKIIEGLVTIYSFIIIFLKIKSKFTKRNNCIKDLEIEKSNKPYLGTMTEILIKQQRELKDKKPNKATDII